MTLTVGPSPVTIEGAADAGAAATLALIMRAPIEISTQPSAPLARGGFYVITAPGLAIDLDPSAQLVFLKDRVGSSRLVVSVDGAADGASFGAPGAVFRVAWCAGLSTWLRF